MVHIAIDLSTLTPAEAKALTAMLGCFSPLEAIAPEAEAVHEASVREPIVPEAEAVQEPIAPEAEAVQEAAEPAKVKRGRPRKEAPPAASETPGNTPPADGGPAIDLVMLRNALQNFSEKQGMPASIELLKDFGVARVSEVLGLPLDEQWSFLSCANA